MLTRYAIARASEPSSETRQEQIDPSQKRRQPAMSPAPRYNRPRRFGLLGRLGLLSRLGLLGSPRPPAPAWSPQSARSPRSPRPPAPTWSPQPARSPQCSRGFRPPARQPSRLTCRCHKRVCFSRPIILLDALLQPVECDRALVERDADRRSRRNHVQGIGGAESGSEFLVLEVHRDRVRTPPQPRRRS